MEPVTDSWTVNLTCNCFFFGTEEGMCFTFMLEFIGQIN